ncbi:MAG: DUF4157 domain-containing protein [Acidimicrobiales bacterium]
MPGAPTGSRGAASVVASGGKRGQLGVDGPVAGRAEAGQIVTRAGGPSRMSTVAVANRAVQLRAVEPRAGREPVTDDADPTGWSAALDGAEPVGSCGCGCRGQPGGSCPAASALAVQRSDGGPAESSGPGSSRAAPSGMASGVTAGLSGRSAAGTRPSPTRVLAALGPGMSMPSSATAPFDRATGGRLPGVRLHADNPLTARLGARALTVGRHVAFAPGQFRPGTPDGDHLINHELAHVVQQDGGHGEVQGSGLTYDGYEAEADAAALAVASGRSPSLSPVRGLAGAERVQRQDHEGDGPSGPAQPAAPVPAPTGAAPTPTGPGAPDPLLAEPAPGPFVRPAQTPARRFAHENMIDFRNTWWADDEDQLREMFEGVMHRRGNDGGTTHAEWLLREFLAGRGHARGTAAVPVISAHAYGARRGDLVQNPYTYMQREERRQRNEAAIASLYPGIAEKAPRVLGRLLAERDQVLSRFETHIHDTMSRLLDEGRSRIDAEIYRYGIERQAHRTRIHSGYGEYREHLSYTYSMDDSLDVQAMAGAARDMLDQRREIDRLEGEVAPPILDAAAWMSSPVATYRLVRYIAGSSEGRLAAKRTELAEKRQRYELLVAIHGHRYPALAAFADDTSALARIADGHGRASTVGQLLFDRLDRISDTRRDLTNGDIRLWRLEQVVEIAKRTGGVTNRSLYDVWIDERHQAAVQSDKVKDYVLSALGVVLGLLAIPATGGASLALTGASLTVGAVSLSRAIDDYRLKRADNLADRAYAIAGEDPSSLWIALEVAGMVIDLGQAISILRSIKGPAKAAVEAGGGTADEAMEAAVRVAEAQRAGLGGRIRQAIGQQRAGAGVSLAETAAGAAGHEGRIVRSMGREAEHALATVPERVGGHLVKVTPGGHLIRCSSCGIIRAEYAVELAGNPQLARSLDDLEEAATAAARAAEQATTRTARAAAEGAAEGVARLTRDLLDQLELIRLGPAVQNGTLTAADMRRVLPGVRINAAATRRLDAVRLLNGLEANHRAQILAALRRLEPDEAASLLTALGRQNPQDVAAAMARRTAGPVGDTVGPATMTPRGVAFADAAEAGLDDWLQVFQTVTRRVDDTTIQAGRRVLRQRMLRAGPQSGWPPRWARSGRDWNAHHVFPVELQDHPVFQVLKRNGGWDHHDPLFNAVALPTNPAVALRSGLPVHQVTREMLSPDAAPGALRVLQGHPNINRRAQVLLDGMEDLMGDPVALRAAVEEARGILLQEILASPMTRDGYRVMF